MHDDLLVLVAELLGDLREAGGTTALLGKRDVPNVIADRCGRRRSLLFLHLRLLLLLLVVLFLHLLPLRLLFIMQDNLLHLMFLHLLSLLLLLLLLLRLQRLFLLLLLLLLLLMRSIWLRPRLRQLCKNWRCIDHRRAR